MKREPVRIMAVVAFFVAALVGAVLVRYGVELPPDIMVAIVAAVCSGIAALARRYVSPTFGADADVMAEARAAVERRKAGARRSG